MKYPFRYPEVYAELARQGLSKSKLARELGISAGGLRYKQTHGDFTGSEMAKTSKYLGRSVVELFGFERYKFT